MWGLCLSSVSSLLVALAVFMVVKQPVNRKHRHNVIIYIFLLFIFFITPILYIFWDMNWDHKGRRPWNIVLIYNNVENGGVEAQ